MNRVLTPTTIEARKNEIRDQHLLDRDLLFTADVENFYIKYDGELIPIGGNCKQNRIAAGDNIEIIRDFDDNGDPILPEVVKLLDDIRINTCTLHPTTADEGIYDWKGTVKLGELHNSNALLLLIKETDLETERDVAGIIGGEIFIKMILDDDDIRYAHYTLTVSSTGSWSLKGAAEAESDVRMIKAKWNNEWYYGIKIPRAMKEVWHNETQQYRVYDENNAVSYQETYRIRIGNGNNGNRARTNIQVLDSTGNVQAVFTDTNIQASSNNRRHYQYIPLDAILPRIAEGTAIPESLEASEWYGKNYHLYFDTYYQSNNDGSITLRLLGGWICNTGGNYNPSSYPDRIVATFNSSDSACINWNGTYVVGSGYPTLTSAMDYTAELCTVSYEAMPFTTESRVIRVVDGEQEVNPRDTEVWFNGWRHVVNPPAGFQDSEIEYTVLSDTSHDNEYFSETFYADDPAFVISKISDLQETGEDNAPYRFVVTGTLNMSQLRQIAALCRNPNRQIFLDLSGATVANDARNWNETIFKGCSSLRGMKIPQGVTSISECCFMWCTYMRYLDLMPSSGTLTSLGKNANSGWSQAVALLTSTRVRDLIVPASVNALNNYFTGSSNVKNLIFLQQGTNPISVQQWTFITIGTSNNNQYDRSVPDGFHAFMTESWYNGYIRTQYRNNSGNSYMWNSTDGWWTQEVVSSIVTYNPAGDQDYWQNFADIYHWSEDLINEVRAAFGYTTKFEIKALTDY